MLPSQVLSGLTDQGNASPSPARHNASLFPQQKQSGICLIDQALAQIGVCSFDRPLKLQARRLSGPSGDAPAVLYGCAPLPAGSRTTTLVPTWDLTGLGPGATADVDVTMPGARRGASADASFGTSIIFVLDCHVWSNNSMRVRVRYVSDPTVDLAAAPRAMQVTKRRVS